ncbi:hypothetical protein R6V09_36020 [Streptomyces sp. W16]|uniref:hypothetical protein n=1 Tax=Streptomyces sp. W16 TaxID=3076631 RepID=UPI00295B8CF7|nr:hypothetical protein [Streptomyces sp. W16]MDV9175506.1 hypothetical protein [Streptomyces sp. W16]
MNTQANRLVGLVLTPLLGACLLAGCGDDRSAGDGGTDSQSLKTQEKRAREVADAWPGSAAAAAWSQGYYPVADTTQPPESGWHTEADKRAYETGTIVRRGKLPTTAITQGKVEWSNGSTLSRPLMEPNKAYQSFAHYNSKGPRLTVTGVKLGETTITTSRGPATVPAWLFTLDGYDAPLKQVAVTPSKLPEPSIGRARQGSTDGLWSIARLAGTTADGRSLTVRATHGACDDGPVVHVLETDENVVLYASVAGEQSGPCSAQLIEQSVKVELRQPLADRVVLDALTAWPVPYGELSGVSPG